MEHIGRYRRSAANGRHRLWRLVKVECVGLKPVQRIVNLRGLQAMCGETMSQVGFGVVSA
jgi:hypothetical protein